MNLTILLHEIQALLDHLKLISDGSSCAWK